MATILDEVLQMSPKAKYFGENKLIVVTENATQVMEMLDNKDYLCDNEMLFGYKPNQAEALLIYYNTDESDNKGYIAVSKEAGIKAMEE